MKAVQIESSRRRRERGTEGRALVPLRTSNFACGAAGFMYRTRAALPNIISISTAPAPAPAAAQAAAPRRRGEASKTILPELTRRLAQWECNPSSPC